MAAITDKTEDELLIEKWIDKTTDDRGPAYVRLAEYGTPVWALIGYLNAVGDVQQVIRDYDISEEAMRAALAFYRQYQAHIDGRILLNQGWD